MNKNKAVGLWLAILLAISVVSFGSCTKKEAAIVFMVGGAPDELEYWGELIREFETGTGFDVRIIRQPTDSDQRRQGLVVALKSKQTDPDVFLMDVVWTGQFMASGWLEPLDSYISEDDFTIEPFFEAVIDLADRYDDTLYALPVYVDGGLLYYRKDLLEEYGYAGPPQTWKELLDYSVAIQKQERSEHPGFYGFVWQGAQYEGLVCTFLEFSSSNGGGMISEGKIRLDTPENIQALRFMQDLIHHHKISPANTFTEMKEEEVRSFFQRGNALFERNWPYAWKLHETEGSAVRGKVGTAPLPHFENKKSVSALGGWHVGISRYCDAKEKAWELVKYITSYRTEKELMLNLGWNPGRKDLYEDEEIKAVFPHLHILSGIFENAVSRPTLPYYTQLSEIIQRYLNACLSGKIQPAQALGQMQEEVENLSGMYYEE